jgi:hypothetical protein
MKRIYHSKLTDKQELYFDGEKLYKLVKKEFKEIKKTKDNRLVVFKLDFSLAKLSYIYYNNITEYYDKINGNCFSIKDINNKIINLSYSDYINIIRMRKNEIINKDELKNKVWKYIPDSIYYISEFGDIISLEGYILKFPSYGSLGKEYNVISISTGRVLDNEYYVHRIVARMFLPEGYKKGLVVNHKDGNKKNNHYKNLEWCSNSENLKHAYNTGLKGKKIGEQNHKSKLKEKDIKDICNMLVYKRMSCKDIGKIYNVDNSVINDIKNKITWTHLECVKNLPKFSKRLMKFLEEEDKLIITKIKEGYSNKDIFNMLPIELQNVIKLSPIIETRTKVNKGLL